VQQAAVADVHPSRLDLPLRDVREPGWQLAHDQSVGERIDEPAHRRRRDVDGPGNRGRVPSLAVTVGEHRPESPHRRGREAEPETGQVPFQERRDVVVSPCIRRLLTVGEERLRQAAALPQVIEAFDTHIGEPEARQLDLRDPPSQGLGAQTRQLGRGAAQHHEATRTAVLVDEHSERREQLRHPLRLVDHDRLAPIAQSEHRVGQPRQISVVLEVEHRCRRRCNHPPGQRGLACLPRAGQEGHRRSCDGGSQCFSLRGTRHEGVAGDRRCVHRGPLILAHRSWRGSARRQPFRHIILEYLSLNNRFSRIMQTGLRQEWIQGCGQAGWVRRRPSRGCGLRRPMPGRLRGPGRLWLLRSGGRRPRPGGGQ